ncbi:flagellar motor protein MotB [Terriglobus sp. 2YAB30_2]|uniref:flagellar motor protein MotB n=1 Tax=unclassified Terriglobus TaxID=2628988 RepID=UPI003F9483C2
MGKKKHAEHVNHERWLVSYADFITLLFAFFVVLFASSQSDKKKEKQMAAAIKAAFSDTRIFDMHSATPALTDGGASVDTKPIEMPLPTAPEFGSGNGNGNGSGQDVAAQIRKAIERAAAKQISAGAISIHQAADGLTISLQEGGFFPSGSAELRMDSQGMLDHIIAALPTNMKIRVEGHSDNRPIHTAQFASNWELSSARASAIAREMLTRAKFDPAMISAAGYAEYHPVTSNETEAGRARNRRVDIVVLQLTSAPPPPPMAPAPRRPHNVESTASTSEPGIVKDAVPPSTP